jgi:mRNA interferase RelE/StbE
VAGGRKGAPAARQALSYRLEVDDRAARELGDLPKEAVQRLARAIRALGDNPRPPGARKLTGREGYRIRVGDYRVLYEVEDNSRLVRIYKVGHRREVYR